MVNFVKILQCLSVCWVANIWYILIIYGEKLLNIFTVIVGSSLQYFRVTLQLENFGNNVIQIFPRMFA